MEKINISDEEYNICNEFWYNTSRKEMIQPKMFQQGM